VHHDVGDVAVYQQLAGSETDDFISGNPAVGAANPQILRRLLARQARKELGILSGHLRRPVAIVRE
jgi:hypothetical protein